MFTLSLCAGLGVVSIGAPVEKPPTPEQVRAMVKKLEEPTWNRVSGGHLKPEDGPPPAVDFAPTRVRGEFARAGQQAIPLLVELYEDHKKPSQARAQAVAALYDFLCGYADGPEPRAFAVLKAGLRDDDVSVRWMTCYACQWLGKHWSWSRRDLAELKAGRQPRFQWAPIEKSALRPTEVKEILPLVMECVKDPDQAVAATAIEAVVKLGEPDVGIKEILDAVNRKEPRVRIAAVKALTEIARDDPKTFPAVLGRAKDDDETVRASAAWNLAMNWPDNQDAADAVVGLLKSPEHKVAFLAGVSSVCLFGKRAELAVGPLIQVIKDTHKITHIGENSSLYSGALRSLGQIGPAAKPAAQVILDHPASFALELNAVEALEKIDADAGKVARARYQNRMEEWNRIYNRSLPPPSPVP